MAITTKTDTYFDDLNVQYADGSHLDKNYLRVLFKPGVNVQTRELNQAQSILQAQIDHLGSSLFKPNSQIIGGEVILDASIGCIEFSINDSNNSQITTNLLNEFNKDLTLLKIKRTDSQSNVSKATVDKIETIENSSINEATHRIYYKNVEGSNLEDVISSSEELTLEFGDFSLSFYSLTPIAYKKAVGLSADSGIYFVKGSLVSVERQYAARPIDDDVFNGYAYFLVQENYISSVFDSTLNDNASNTSNFLEQGADRYQIVLTLKLLTDEDLSLDQSIASNAVKLADIRSNEIYLQYNGINQSGSTLEDTLAKRTYEESGNYVVKNFDLELKELYGDDYNSVYSDADIDPSRPDFIPATDITLDDADNYFVAKLSPGIAYVTGRRVETLAPTILSIPKATKTYKDLAFERNNQRIAYKAVTSAVYGNYVVGYTSGITKGLPDFENDNVSYDLLGEYGQEIGQAKIVSIEPEGIEAPGQVKARVYLYDIVLNNGYRFNDVTEIISSAALEDYGTFNFIVEKVNGIALNDIDNEDSIFEFSEQAITEITNIVVSRRVAHTTTLTEELSVVTIQPTSSSKQLDASSSNIIVAKDEEIITDGYYIIPASDGAISIIFDNPQPPATVISVIASETGNIEDETGIKLKTTEDIDLTLIEGDVYSLDGVYHAISIDQNDKNWILVDDGQRSNSYVNAKVRKVGSTSITTVNVTHWRFLDTNKVYTVNSYKTGDEEIQVQATLNEIPTYGDINLSDALDCRSIPGRTRLSLDPYSAIVADIDFYLPRIDLINVSSNSVIERIGGQADIEAKMPNISDNGMAIYALYIPPFTAAATDVEVRAIENRRYTMSDIAGIERRIGAIEYYTSLSLLERDANDRSIFGPDGEKFKNGFITDSFRNLDVADTNAQDFLCSIDSSRGILYPYHTGYSIPLKPTNLNGVSITKNNKAFLNYSEIDVDYLTQSSASQFIDLQPHEQSANVGIMKLTPEVDTWSKKIETPDTTIELYKGFDNLLRDFANESGFTGTQWNSWVTTSQVSKKVKSKKQAAAFLKANGVTGVNVGSFGKSTNLLAGIATWPFGSLFGFGRTKKKRITIKNQIASGIQTNLAFEDIQQSLGEYVKDVNISTFMRTRSVLVDISGVKANTKFFAYFDDKNVTSYVKLLPEDFNIEAYDQTADEGLSQAALLEKYSTNPQLELKSDDDGNILAMFIIPNDSTFKFTSGEKLLRFSNSPRNSRSEEDSFAEARFISNGLDIDTGETIISTQVPRVKRQEVTRNRLCVRKNDPIAQTFRVLDDSGIFATSIELAFASKPPAGSDQVQVYLVTVANGYPTDTIIPGSETSLTNAEIQISDDARTITRFEFDGPVYLEPNTEYAIVAYSGSFGYKAYISDLGASDISNDGIIISEQPASGVFFTSANKTAWTAYQNRDLKFKIKRAKFNSFNGTLLSNPVIGNGLHRVDVRSFASDDPEDTFENIGWVTGTVTVTVDAPPTSTNSKLAVVRPVFNSINTSIIGFTIIEPGYGYITDPKVTVVGTIGTTTRTAKFDGKRPQYRIGAFNLNQKFIELSGKTQISNILDIGTASATRTYSVEAGEPVENVINANFAIAATTKDSVRLSTTLVTSDDRISPVIDLDSLSLETREYAVKPSGSTSRYYVKSVDLSTPADELDVFVDINRPTPTSDIKIYGQFFDENNNPIHNKYFTRTAPNALNKYAGVKPGDVLVTTVATPTTVAIITDIQQVDGVYRYYYNETTPIVTSNTYTLKTPSGTPLASIATNSIALQSDVETDWIELKPAQPKTIPVNSDRNIYSEVKFTVNPAIDFKRFSVKIEFRGENYIDVPTVKNFRAIASL